MKKLIFLVLVLIGSIQNTHAHNALSAMYYLEVREDMSILNISLSQAGLNEALKKHYSKIELEQLSNIDYKQLVVTYLRENFDLNINGNTIPLLDGGIKLGSHETDAKFIINNLPKPLVNLNVKIKAFSENEHHQTIFSLLYKGHTSKVILNQNNGYSVSTMIKDDLMETSTNRFNNNYLWFIAIIPIFLFGKKLITKAN